jgi:hypothetical protein
MIDPTTEDNWLRDNFSSRPYVQKGETFETYHPGPYMRLQRDVSRVIRSRNANAYDLRPCIVGIYFPPLIRPGRSCR